MLRNDQRFIAQPLAGISSYTYTWSVGVPGSLPRHPWSETDLISKAVELGADCVQIADNLPLHNLSGERLQRLRDLAGDHSVGIEVGARHMNPKNLERYIELAGFFHSPLLRFVIDGEGYQPSVKEVIQVIRTFVPELERKNIVLVIENHDRLKASEFRQIVTSVGSDHVGICLDSVNSMGAGEGIETVTALLAPYTYNFHVKEFVVERHAHKMGFTVHGCPLGKGQLPLSWMLGRLTGKCRSAILEQWVPPEADIGDTVRKEQQWAKESFNYLKDIIRNNKITH